MRKIFEKCPACQAEVIVTRINCTQCTCEITGQFQPTIFNRLSPESLAFVETFVRLRGNIKEMERELGVPYGTIRNRLDNVITELGFASGSQETRTAPSNSSRRQILQDLEDGEITAQEAAERLEKLK